MPRKSAYKLNKTVALVGMMGSGKSAVGQAVARKLGVAFVDSDHAIEEAANRSVAEIFERDGEAFFRDKETRVLARLLDGPPVILSTGGGAFLNPRNRDLIAARGVAVWLKADLPLLWQRVRHKDTRPLLRVPEPRKRLAELLEARTPHYAQAAIVVEADAAYSIDDMAARVIAALEAHPAGILERVSR
ncbi:shikimate kinase [Maritimibacter sp. 55A14]|uniref:shikimate kinase n=1 Tax=Maritimibacter sp. 55A14 TaxID=2174844 RepID=UPI000D61A56D|nr:shikimate kinase [Maritimibacter sp. 55A14]PWE34220.1 shikimate kinase [Maritimibacter sp. 55A14]